MIWVNGRPSRGLGNHIPGEPTSSVWLSLGSGDQAKDFNLPLATRGIGTARSMGAMNVAERIPILWLGKAKLPKTRESVLDFPSIRA